MWRYKRTGEGVEEGAPVLLSCFYRWKGEERSRREKNTTVPSLGVWFCFLSREEGGEWPSRQIAPAGRTCPKWSELLEKTPHLHPNPPPDRKRARSKQNGPQPLSTVRGDAPSPPRTVPPAHLTATPHPTRHFRPPLSPLSYFCHSRCEA